MNVISKSLLLFSFFCVNLIVLVFGEKMCSSLHSMNYGVQWPNTSTRTISDPPLVDQSKEFVYRECVDGVWGSEPSSCIPQQKNLPECPEGFTEYFTYCYVFTEQSKYPSRCPFPNYQPFNIYQFIIVKPEMPPVWMPVQRNVANGLGFLRWKEAGNLYNEEYTDYDYKDTIKGKDCVVFYNSSYKLAVSCNEQYNSVCVYHKLSFTDDMCGDCTLFSYNNNITCFCFANTTGITSKYLKAEFLKPYQNQVYFTKYSGMNCSIGLEKTTKGEYIWSNTKNDIDYTFWSPDVVFDDTHVYGAISSTGWFLTEEPLECYFYQKLLDLDSPDLDLMWVPDQKKFFLFVRNSNTVKLVDNSTLIYCFTDAAPWDLLYRYTNLDGSTQINTYSTYQFLPQTSGPGSYWCSVVNSLNSEIVETEHVFFNGTSLEFVSILSIHYIQGNNPLANEILIVLKEALSWKLSGTVLMEKYIPRIMQLSDVDEKNRILLVNVHFTAILEQLDHDSEFFQLRSNLQEALNNTSDIEIEIMDFLSSDYCLAEQNLLSWPRTKLGNTIVSQEYCFKPNGDRLNRTCGGSFYLGAKWSFVETCTIANASSETSDLEVYLNKYCANLNKVFSIMQNYKKLNALDIYLIGLILYKQNTLSTDDMKNFLNGLDSILKINRTTLQESQYKMRATDMLLFLTENLTNSRSSVYNMTNFFFETTNKSTGLSCFNTSNKFYISTSYSMDVAKKETNFQMGFWLSAELQDQVQDNLPTMAMFYDNNLFTEGLSSTSSEKVMGFLWNSNDAFKGSVYAIDRIRDGDVQKDCVIWTYSLQMRGFWKRTAPAERLSPFWFCVFQQPGYFTISNSNVTGNLEKVLNDDNDVNVTLQSLTRISERYDEFNVFDIHLVGQIFNKVSIQQDIDLNAIAKTVNHMHEIDRLVLLESQEERASTDVILHQIDNILQNQKNQSRVEIPTTNFVVYIADINITDFTGLGITEDNEYRILLGEVNITDILALEHLNSALVLSHDLKKQLNAVDNAKIILTIYNNDALFNEKMPTGKFVGKIFGVLLPDIGNYTGPLKIMQKISSKYSQPCAYWYYNNPDNIRGAWKKDNNSTLLSDFVICEYWHTTHFALLLLDKNETDPNANILDRITTVNLALSAVGLGMIIVTAIIFSNWRRSSGNQILLNFSISIFLQIITFYVSSIVNQSSQDYILCTVIGVILHYSIVSSFAWMLIIAILQFKRFVEVFVSPPKRILLKCFLGGWIAPLIPAVYVLLFDGDNYVSGNIGLCYPSGLGLYLGVWFPLGTIILINIFLFVYIIFTVARKKTELVSNIGKNETVLQWRLGILLFFMLGLTWIFGFMAEFGFGEVFVYLFCFLATLQGFVVFLFFIVFNTNTRRLYYKGIKNCFARFS